MLKELWLSLKHENPDLVFQSDVQFAFMTGVFIGGVLATLISVGVIMVVM